MPNSSPIGISRHSDLLPGCEGIVARTFALVPGPDAIARGRVLGCTDETVPIADKPRPMAVPTWMQAVFTRQDLDGVTN